MRMGLGHLPGMGMARSSQPTPMAASPAQGNVIATVNLGCRGINRDTLSPHANNDLAYYVLQYVTNSPYFTDKSSLVDNLKPDPGSNTFSFSLILQLKHPFKL